MSENELDYPRVALTAGRMPPGTYAAAWKPVQEAVRRRIVIEPLAPLPRFVCGADCAFGDGRFAKDATNLIYAIALVWDRVEGRVVERSEVVRSLEAPYIPTFLSFREGPAIEEAIGKLKHLFGAVCFDGQGMAHPRRCGVASHVGVRLNVPTIGIAKSILCGEHGDLPERAGASSPLVHRDEVVGAALRTRDNVRPVYVSVGHRVDLDSAIALALACVTRYRIPEPTRLADIEVAKLKSRHVP